MTGGVRTALEEVLEGQGTGDQVAQLALFDAEEIGATDAPSPLSAALPTKARTGRPPGSRNRRTDAVVGWLLAQHRHPLSVMMEAYTMSPVELAERLGLAKGVWINGGKDRGMVCVDPEAYPNETLVELAKLQFKMAEAVAPYVAQRQPIAVDLGGKAALTLSFEGVSLPARGGLAGPVSGEDGEGLALRLPGKSDAGDRTDG